MRASAAASFKKVSQALHDSPQLPCAVLLGDSTVRGTLRHALGGGSSKDTGAVEAETLDGICLVDCPDPQTAEAATELATFLRGLHRTNGFVLACEESEENIPLETLMLLTGFYGISLPWPHLAIAMSAAPSKGNEASKREVTLKRRLRCDSATFGGGKVKPPGKLSVFLLGGSEGVGKGSKNDELGRLKEFLKKCKPLKCDPTLSTSPLLSQFRSISEKLANQRTGIASPRRPPMHGPRLLAMPKSKSPDGMLPMLNTNAARLASAGGRFPGKPRSSSEGGSMHYSDGTTQLPYADSSSASYSSEILPPLHNQMPPGMSPYHRWAHGAHGPPTGPGIMLDTGYRHHSMMKSASDGCLTPPGSRQMGPNHGLDVSRHQLHFGVGAPRGPSSMRGVGLPYLSTTGPNQRWAYAESDFSGSDRFRHGQGYGYGSGSDGGYGYGDRRWERWNPQQQQPKPNLSQTYGNERWYDGGSWSGWRDAGWSSDDNWQNSWWKDDSAWNKEEQPEDTSKKNDDSKDDPGSEYPQVH